MLKLIYQQVWLSQTVIVDRPNLIQIPFDFNLINKKYVDGEWVEYTPDPVPEKERVTDETILKMASTVDYIAMMAE